MKKIIFSLLIVFGFTFFYSSQIYNFLEKTISSIDTQGSETLERSNLVSFKQAPIFVESKGDSFYFVSDNPKPTVIQDSVDLNAKTVDFDNLTYPVSKEIQSKSYLVEVLAHDVNQDTDVLTFEIDGYSVEVDNPYYFSFDFKYDNDSQGFIELLFNQNFSNDYKKFVSVEPELNIDLDIDGPGHLVINTNNWSQNFYKITFEPGFFNTYNQPKTFVLEKKQVNYAGFRNSLPMLSMINPDKNEIDLYLARDKKIDFKIYKFDTFDSFYSEYLKHNSSIKFDFKNKEDQGVISVLENQEFDYDSFNSSLDIPGLNEGYYLLRNGNEYSFLQKVKHDIYFSGSSDEKSFYVYDFDEGKFIDFKISYLGKQYSSSDKIHSVDISNIAYTNNIPFVIDDNGKEILVTDFLYINYRDKFNNLYSHLSLDKPRYKLGDKINGNIVLGDFNKEYSHNTVVARLSTVYSNSITSKRGLIAEQRINLDSFGSADFDFQIPEFIDGNSNYLYVSFFWDGKLIKSEYLELLKVDKAQTLMSASFDKSFYLLGENVNLNVETKLYNGEPKGNVKFYSTYFTDSLFADSFENEIFETNSDGKFNSEFRIQPNKSLFENLYSPKAYLNMNLEALDKKGENIHTYASVDYYLTLIDVNFSSEAKFDSNLFDYSFNLNEVLPGEISKIGNPIANKDVTVEYYLSGRYTNEFTETFYSKNPEVIETVGLVEIIEPVFEDSMQETPEPVLLDESSVIKEFSNSDAESLMVEEDSFSDNLINQKSRANLNILEDEFVKGKLSSSLIYDVTGLDILRDEFIGSKKFKTDAYGRVADQIEIFENASDLRDFNYVSLVMKVSYMEDGIKKSFRKSFAYSPWEDNFEDKFKSLKVIDIDGEKVKENFEDNGLLEAFNYKLGSKIKFEIEDFSNESQYILMIKNFDGISSEFINSKNFEIEVTSKHLPNFDIGVIEVNKDGAFYIHNNPYIKFDDSFEIKNLNSKKTYLPGEEYELNLEFEDSFDDTFVNVKMVDKKLYSRYSYESSILDSIFANNYNLSFGNYFGERNDFGGKGGCFLKDSKILMADGTQKNIQDIIVGDSILTFDEKEIGKNKKAVVQGLQTFYVTDYLIINNNLEVTPNHQVFSNGEFKSVYLVEKGDTMIKDGKKIIVEEIQKVKLSSPIKVYNFTVSPYHTYIVDGYFVHNEGKGDVEMMAAKDVRKNFQDVVFFDTFLTSGKNILEKFKLPDDITTYKLFVSAFEKDKFRKGFLEDEISTNKDIIVEPLFPSKVNKGDKLELEFGIYGKEAKNIQKAFVKINDQENLIENPALENSFKYDFNQEGNVNYTLGVESENANDYYQDNISVIDNSLMGLSSMSSGLNFKDNSANRVVVQDEYRNFAYFNALKLLNEIENKPISSFEEKYTMDNLNYILNNQVYDSIIGDKRYYEIFNIDSNNSTDNFVSDLSNEPLTKNNFNALLNTFAYNFASKYDSQEGNLKIDSKYFLQDYSILDQRMQIFYFILAADYNVFYFDELENFKDVPFYYFAKSHLLKKYNLLAKNFRLNYFINDSKATAFSNNGEVVLDFYKDQEVDFAIDFEKQNLFVYSQSYQSLSLDGLKVFRPEVKLMEDNVYSFIFDFNQFKQVIFNDNSRFKLSMIIPTGFELINNRGDYEKCTEYVRNLGGKIEINLQKYYYDKLNKYECNLDIEFKMRPNFKGEIVLPSILMKSNLHKFVSDPMIIKV